MISSARVVLTTLSYLVALMWSERAPTNSAPILADFVAVCGLFYGLLAGKDTHFPGRRVGIPHEQMDLIMSYKIRCAVGTITKQTMKFRSPYLPDFRPE